MIRRNSREFSHTLLLASLALFIGLLATAVPAFAQTAGTWTKTGRMPTPRLSPTATLLQNGQVLVSGGQDSTGNLTSAVLYDPVHGNWAVTGSMNTFRGGYTATVLKSGLMLAAGGSDANLVPLSSAELYDVATGKWTFTASMSTARNNHTATLLPSGLVLVAGGNGHCVPFSCPAFASAELYDPSTGTWTPTGSMSTARTMHSATLLLNGQVLVAGGTGTNGDALFSAELYNPVTGTWSTTGSDGSGLSTQWLLADGKVLRGGGYNAELYDPATGVWTPDGGACCGTSNGSNIALLGTGKVLSSGGIHFAYPAKDQIFANAYLFDPSTGQSSPTGSMTIPRVYHSLTLLSNGQALAAGGETQDKKGNISITDAAELYTP